MGTSFDMIRRMRTAARCLFLVVSPSHFFLPLLWCLTVPILNAVQLLNCGDVVQGAINAVGQTMSYNLAGEAGDVVRLTSVGKTGDLTPDIDIFNMAGERLGGFSANDGGATWLVPRTGTYTVVVRDRNDSHIGTYSLGVIFLSPKCAATSLTCGMVLTNTIADAAQQHTYYLKGNAGDVVRLTTSSQSDVLVDFEFFGSNGGRVGGGLSFNDGVTTWSVPLTDNYTVVVRGRDSSQTGVYGLGVAFTNPKCDSLLLTCGAAFNGDIVNPAEQKVYTVSGFYGETLRFTSVPFSGEVQPDFDIFDQIGERIASFRYDSLASRFMVPRPDPRFHSDTNTTSMMGPSTFTLIVGDRTKRNTGSYRLMLEVEGGCSRLRIGSAIVRTQEVACLPVQYSLVTPVQTIAFNVNGSAENLQNLVLQTEPRFDEANVILESSNVWRVYLRTSPTTPLSGEGSIGSLCFQTASTYSAFIPVQVTDVEAISLDGAPASLIAFGGRIVAIAESPLLEATFHPNGQRAINIFGTANTSYVVSRRPLLSAQTQWIPAFTNFVGNSLFTWLSLPTGPSNGAFEFFWAAKE